MGLDPRTQGQIQEFLRVFRRRRWQIILPALFVLTAGSVFAVIVPKKFVVTTEIEVREGPRGQSDAALRPRSPTAVREIANVQHHIKHHERVRKVVDREGDLWEDYVRLTQRQKYEYVEGILRNINVVPRDKKGKEGSEFVEISYRDIDGDRAERFLKDLVQAFIDAVMERDLQQLSEEVDDLQNQLLSQHKACLEARKRYSSLAGDMEIDPSMPQRGAGGREGDPVFRQLEELKSGKGRVELDIAVAETEKQHAEAALKDEPPNVQERIKVGEVDLRQQITAWEREVQQLEQQQKRYTPANSKWKKLDEEIRLRQEYIAEAKILNKDPTVRYFDKPNPALPALRKELAVAITKLESLLERRRAINTQIQNLDGETKKRTEQYEDLWVAYEEKEDLQELLSETRHELGNKRKALQTMQSTYDLEGRPYEIVKAAHAKDHPEVPNPWIIVVFSIFAGLALGMSLSLVTEYGRNSYRSVGDVTGVMAVPVLGAINTIVTTAEARRTQLRRAFVGMSTAVILGGLAWFTWIWANDQDRLPTEIRQAIDEFRRMLM